jgi:hypothetical protein
MKKPGILLFILTIATVLLSACGAAAATPSVVRVAPKVDAVPVAFIGIIDSMAGDQWVINGNTVTVAADVVRDGPFNVGDQVKVQGAVSPDGSFAVSRVEPPTATDLSSLPPFGNGNSNSNTNDANVNDVNSNDDNSNAANSNDVNLNDDNGNSVNSNDSNANDDNGNNVNSNDDHGGGSHSNDDHGNDDHSAGGHDDNSDRGGGVDHGGGGNDNDD